MSKSLLTPKRHDLSAAGMRALRSRVHNASRCLLAAIAEPGADSNDSFEKRIEDAARKDRHIQYAVNRLEFHQNTLRINS